MGAGDIELWGVIYQFASAFVLFFIVPIMFYKLVGRDKLRDIGLGLGDWKFGLVDALIGLLRNYGNVGGLLLKD